MSTCGGDIAA